MGVGVGGAPTHAAPYVRLRTFDSTTRACDFFIVRVRRHLHSIGVAGLTLLGMLATACGSFDVARTEASNDASADGATPDDTAADAGADGSTPDDGGAARSFCEGRTEKFCADFESPDLLAGWTRREKGERELLSRTINATGHALRAAAPADLAPTASDTLVLERLPAAMVTMSLSLTVDAATANDAEVHLASFVLKPFTTPQVELVYVAGSIHARLNAAAQDVGQFPLPSGTTARLSIVMLVEDASTTLSFVRDGSEVGRATTDLITNSNGMTVDAHVGVVAPKTPRAAFVIDDVTIDW